MVIRIIMSEAPLTMGRDKIGRVLGFKILKPPPPGVSSPVHGNATPQFSPSIKHHIGLKIQGTEKLNVYELRVRILPQFSPTLQTGRNSYPTFTKTFQILRENSNLNLELKVGPPDSIAFKRVI